MKAFFFSMATLLIMLAASCGDEPLKITEEKPESSKLGNPNPSAQYFTVDAPAGWTKKDTIINAAQFCYITAAALDSNFNTNINVVSEPMQNQTLDDYTKNAQATMKSYMPGFSIIENGEIQAVDLKGSWFRYVMVQSGIKMDAINYTFTKNGMAYVITGAAKAGSMEKYRAVFDAIARSFKLKN